MQFNKGVCSSGQGGMHYCIGCASCVVLCCTVYTLGEAFLAHVLKYLVYFTVYTADFVKSTK